MVVGFYGLAVGAGSLGGVDSVVVGGGVEVDPVEVGVEVVVLPPVAPSDMHHPPLSDIQ